MLSMRGALRAALVFGACSATSAATACAEVREAGARAATATTPTAGGAVDAPTEPEGEEDRVPMWREGTPGLVLLFVRNVVSLDVQRTAERLANEFVSECEPAYDAVAVVEPGIALAIPNIHERADAELATRRRWRADCLHGLDADMPLPLANERASEQVALVLDPRGAIRRDALGGDDPGGDIVVAAFGRRGEPLFRTSVANDASYTERERVFHAAVDAVRAAKR